MPVERRIIQSTYISKEAKQIIEEEAKKRNMFTTTLASEIIEKEAKKIARKERHGKNNQV